jgi:hypothetical protein
MESKYVLLGVAGAIAAGLVYAAFTQDSHDSATADAPDAGDLVPRMSVLGTAHTLPSKPSEPRVELTFSLNADLITNDLGSVSPTSPFVIGQMRTGTMRQKVDADIVKVSIRHRILPAVAWFTADAAKQHRAWVDKLAEWELAVTQSELAALYPDASAPDAGPPPPSLTIHGPVVSYSEAAKRFPDLAGEPAKKFLCMGEDVCDDSVLSSVLVLLVE